MKLFYYLKKNLSKDKECLKLFIFINFLAFLTLLEIIYGLWLNSLSLISSAMHSFFDCISLIITLFAIILSKKKPNKKFSYGYDRIEVLSDFSHSAFLLFVSIYLLVESGKHFFEPTTFQKYKIYFLILFIILNESFQTNNLLLVAFLGILINSIGVLFFGNYRQSRLGIFLFHFITI